MKFGTTALLSALSCLLSSERVGADSHNKIGVELVADGLGSPIDLIFAPGDDTTRYVVDQNGFIFVLDADDNVNTEDPFLNITEKVEIQDSFDERGMLGVAFHPQFAENGLLYVLYTAERENSENTCYGFDGEIPSDPELGCPFQHHKVIAEFIAVDGKVDKTTERRVFSLVSTKIV